MCENGVTVTGSIMEKTFLGNHLNNFSQVNLKLNTLSRGSEDPEAAWGHLPTAFPQRQTRELSATGLCAARVNRDDAEALWKHRVRPPVSPRFLVHEDKADETRKTTRG